MALSLPFPESVFELRGFLGGVFLRLGGLLVGLRVGLGVDGGGALGFEDSLVQHEHAMETAFGELRVDVIRRVLFEVLELCLRQPVVRLDKCIDVLDNSRGVIGRGEARKERGSTETSDRAASQVDEMREVIFGGLDSIGMRLGGGGKTKCCVVEARDKERKFCGLRN
jgi:hypothetical protein